MTDAASSPRINSDRLWERLQAMAAHGATANGGCNRQALTDTDRAGRDLFLDWCREAGCEVRIDAIGNIFARRPGSEAEAAPVLAGSHLDTQPTGGKYDGVYGVLAGLEVIETLNDGDIHTRHPLEVVVWTNEEGCRFDTAMMGSAVWSGAMPLAEARALTDRDGHSVGDELQRIGYQGEQPAQPFPVHAAFELHIEQGPVLEAEELAIGVVTGVQHMSRHRVIIDGVATHAGPTPMAMRRDPMMALAALLPALFALATEQGPDARVTCGFVQARPGSSNTVPEQVELTVDIRHPELARYQALEAGLEAAVAAASARYQLDGRVSCFWEAPGVTFDPDCVAAVAQAVQTLGYSHRKMVSGAGHDACNLAGVVPTSMIFIPCEGGISHNEAEAITRDQAEQGANVLLLAMLERAGVAA
ncbi:Zn-dependent hydrolase [Haliea sp. E1-2-M8]|uniref:Zn-dependent hydrolase n=1 Tax=Haliea sp. E1-2-M8 TaxID=3064706 RepID=UPI002723DD22|nr:Zn-dependent hydrolase [Haliea sp. E1-2-M8]MDO8861514.1 Zn-dependent hydrolase [Haliea sp. E1-2-M8]